MLRDQLDVYKTLNVDLSKKVQDLKVELTAVNKELFTIRNDLMTEKVKSSELRKCILTLHGHSTQYFDGFFNSIQSFAQKTDLEMTIPGHHHHSNSSTAVTPAVVRSQRPALRVPEEQYISNRLLNTICEESQDENRFSLDGSPSIVSSTPMVAAGSVHNKDANRANFNSTFNFPLAPISQNNENVNEANTVPPTPIRKSRPTSRRLSDDPMPQRKANQGKSQKLSLSQEENETNLSLNETSNSQSPSNVNETEVDSPLAGDSQKVNKTADESSKHHDEPNDSNEENEQTQESQKSIRTQSPPPSDSYHQSDSESEDEPITAPRKRKARHLNDTTIGTVDIPSTVEADSSDSEPEASRKPSPRKRTETNNNKENKVQHDNETSGFSAGLNLSDSLSVNTLLRAVSIEVVKHQATEEEIATMKEWSAASTKPLPPPPRTSLKKRGVAARTIDVSSESQDSMPPPKRKSVKRKFSRKRIASSDSQQSTNSGKSTSTKVSSRPVSPDGAVARSISIASTSSVDSQESVRSTRNKRMKLEVKPRKSGPPKRRACLAMPSMSEKSLRKKLRRSK